MASNNPSLVVKIGANIEALKAALELGQKELIKTAAGATALASSFNGQKMEQAALQTAVAIKALGGAATLTVAEAKRADATMSTWLEKAQKMGKAVSPELAKIAEETKKVAKETEDAHKKHESWFSSLTTGVMTGHLLAEALMKVGETAIEWLKEAAHWVAEIALEGSRELGIEKAFKRLTTGAGQDGLKLLHELQTATHGTIEESALMIRVNENLAAGMKLTSEQYQTLAKGAFALAKATGKDTKEALDAMSDAMLTGRTRAIALLTGKIDLKDAEERFAKSLGATAEQLNAEGKIEATRQAILESVGKAVDRLGEQTDGLGTKVKQAKVAWKDFQDELGKAVASSPVLMTVVNNIGEVLSKAFGVAKEQAVMRLGMAIDQLAISAVGLAADLAPAIGVIGTEFNALQVVARNVLQFLDLMLLGIKQIALAGVEAIDAMTPGEQFAAQQVRLRTEIAALRIEMIKRKDAMDADKQAEDEWWNLGERLKVQLTEMQAKMEASRRTYGEHAEAAKHAGETVEQAGANAANAGRNFLKTGEDAEEGAKKLKSVEDAAKTMALTFETMKAQGASSESIFAALGSEATGMREKFAALGKEVPEDVQKVVDAIKTLGMDIQIAKWMEQQRADVRRILEEMAKDTEALATKQRDALNKAFVGNLEAAIKAENEITALKGKEVDERIAFLKKEMDAVAAGYTKGRESYETYAREIRKLEESRYNDAVALIKKEMQARRDALDKNAATYKMALDAINALEDERLREALRKWLANLDALKEGTKTKVQNFGQVFVSLGQVFDGINSKMGQTFQTIGNAMEVIGKTGESMGNKMVAGFSAAASIVQQYAEGTVIAAAATGAMSGAAAGMALATIGSWTAMGATFAGVGAVIGALIGSFSALAAESARNAAINQEATNAYVKMRKELMALVGTEDDLRSLAASIGDVTANGQDLAEVLVYLDSYNFSGTGKLDYLKAAIEEFQRKQTELLKSVQEGTRLASKELLDFMGKAAKVSGEFGKTARAYFAEWAGVAAGGLTAMFAALEKGATAAAQAAAVKLHMAAGMSEADAKKAAESVTGIYVKTQAQATGLASSIAATFAKMIEGGATFREALAAIKGPLDAMRKQLEATGFSGGAAFENLSRMGQIADGAISGPLMDAITGATQALQGLHNSGLLNQEMFSGLTTTITDTYNQLIAQGVDGQAALQMMQPSLQTIWELQQKFGYEVDAATQAMIDQAVEAGNVGAAHMSAQDQTAAAMNRVVDVLEAMATFMGVTLPAAAESGAKAIDDAFSQVDPTVPPPWEDWGAPPDLTFQYTYEPTNEPEPPQNGYASGGVVYASGGWQTKGSDIVPAMLTPGERVLTVGQNYDYENRMRMGGESGEGPVNVNITIQALDPIGLKKVVEDEVGPLLVSAYRRNAKGLRTDTRKELVE